MTKARHDFNITQFRARWTLAKRRIPIKIARRSENFFKDSFVKGGFTDEGFKPWDPRKKQDPGRALLVKSGALKRATRSVPGATFQRIDIANEKGYAHVHNEGGKFVPARPFMKESKKLNIGIKKDIESEINQVFK